MANEYDIVQAFQKIEEELIASMKRNLTRHIKEEKKEGFNWNMWQAEQLKSLKVFREQNPELFKKYFSTIDKDIEEVLKKSYESGQTEQENLILETLKKSKVKKTKSSFFKINDRKLNALIDEAQTGISKASSSILRYTNDQYRKIIFNAQVYANTGAGTPEKAIDMATKDFLSAGINSIEYSNGARINIASYAAMAIQTANKRAYLQGEGVKRNEWGIHTVLVHNRGGGCPFCSKYQGKVFIDDVWSGGTSKESEETGYPLLSSAIAGGLYHPNCKDKHTTYFPEISSEPTPPTKEELEIKKQNYIKDQKLKNIERNIEKYKRLELGSVDPENIKKYHNKRIAWQEYKKRFKKDSNESFYKVTNGEKDDIMPKNIKKEVKENVQYLDITNEMYNTAKPNRGTVKIQKYFEDDGKMYKVDGRNVVYKHDERELEVARLLNKTFGGNIKILPNINFPQGVKSPDYLFRGERTDLKRITSKRANDCVKTALRNKEKQANNFIIDNTAQNVSDTDILKQIDEIYNSKGFLWVDKIYLLRNDKFIKIFKRK